MGDRQGTGRGEGSRPQGQADPQLRTSRLRARLAHPPSSRPACPCLGHALLLLSHSSCPLGVPRPQSCRCVQRCCLRPRRWTGRIPLGLCTWPPQNEGRRLQDRRGALCFAGGQLFHLRPSAPGSLPHLHSGALQSGGKCRGCLRPALTWTQLCDDVGTAGPRSGRLHLKDRFRLQGSA